MWRLGGVTEDRGRRGGGGGAGQSEGGRTSGVAAASEQSCVSAKEEYGGYDWTGTRREGGLNCGASRPSFIVDRLSEPCTKPSPQASTHRRQQEKTSSPTFGVVGCGE